ncbi:hypothetical protein C7444_108136 [Sphaerotilus hippei]|uniref:GDSL-like lipase/acylhydrolase family protein n=2 Tax=Sphaerotilus hippei TaxID=744406 RepID=A0A318H7Y5_9BURK|nr:hypothetical protein C7444_108136 [Sphaerotilus hippei]
MSAFESVQPSADRRWVRWGGRIGSMLLGATLVACGGAQRVEEYAPTKVVSFGDELSVIVAGSTSSTGRKYSVNALATDGSLDCTSNAIWNQVLADNYSLPFDVCTSATNPPSRIQATVGATVDDVVAQVTTYRAANTFAPATLVTVLAGMHDVLAAFEARRAGTLTQEAALAQVAAAGTKLGALVNSITDSGAGARVVYSTVPSLIYSPYVRGLASADDSAVLTALTERFNTEFRANVTNEGRYAGLVQAHSILSAIITTPSTYSVTNVADAACSTALPDCTTSTLITDATASTYLWADAKRPGLPFHSQLGLAAVNRARNNPF